MSEWRHRLHLGVQTIMTAIGVALIVYGLVGLATGNHFFAETFAKTTESNIETIRASQRECLAREPAHSFSLAQTQGGYMIQCEPIK